MSSILQISNKPLKNTKEVKQGSQKTLAGLEDVFNMSLA